MSGAESTAPAAASAPAAGSAAAPAAGSATAPILVAIDGPAGSGKSSVSRAAATRLGFGILDTGAAYRALAWAALETGADLDAEPAVLELLGAWRFDITLRGEQRVTVVLPGASAPSDVTAAIREHAVSGQVSRVSQHPAVRDRLNDMFRAIVAGSGLPGVVIEGRDITTVVAPDAPVRILMTASPEVRAERRAGELSGVSREQVLADIIARDAKDTLVVDFMNPAPGVTLVDTSDLDFEQSIQAVIDVVQAAPSAAVEESM
ncbi:(d)CMP kinase [Leucobacter rhizosphaerae]|uniref:Cytidylate kinase n=1 Tax=Leucobacter rhizosphaerae TaxID=2932245 RepID=A0ABY4FZ28_9MICO|nr:(d)CMP kinase [Leucobacter rhizosphaerae]UOQ61547.1 (d)CMP kinase [Leucobacter rhizosphaerae]